MPRFFVKTNQIQGNCIEIIGKDVNHIKNALRTKIGDKIEICDEETEKSYISQIEKIEENKILTKIIQELEKNESKIKIDIYGINNTKISRTRCKLNNTCINEKMRSKT